MVFPSSFSSHSSCGDSICCRSGAALPLLPTFTSSPGSDRLPLIAPTYSHDDCQPHFPFLLIPVAWQCPFRLPKLALYFTPCPKANRSLTVHNYCPACPVDAAQACYGLSRSIPVSRDLWLRYDIPRTRPYLPFLAFHVPGQLHLYLPHLLPARLIDVAGSIHIG